MRVLILRGIPGSGKTTYAKSIPGAVICSADDHFVGEDGVYRYDGAKIGAAHAVCLRKFIRALEDGAETVIVDNTNIRIKHLSVYLTTAKTFGYAVEVIAFHCTKEQSLARNVHGVPAATVDRMLQDFDDLSPETVEDWLR